MADVGLVLAPAARWLELLDGVIRRDVDYLVVTPETTWRLDQAGALRSNGFHRRFLALKESTGLPVVAHGVGMSVGSRDDDERQTRWLERVAKDHEAFQFGWYTDHLGISTPAGRSTALPLPLPFDEGAATVVRDALRRMRDVVPHVGVENTVTYFTIDDPLVEPRFINACVADEGSHLLLDLHNLFTMSQNLAFDPRDWLAAVDLSKVIEIHVSGGAPSEPEWLSSGRVRRLDSHDHAVPEPVWALLDEVLPKAPNLRGVTLERMEGTVDAPDVLILEAELQRIREAIGDSVPRQEGSDPRQEGSVRRSGRADVGPRSGPEADRERSRTEPVVPITSPSASDPEWESALVSVIYAPDPLSALAEEPRLSSADRDGVELAALLVARLRFERLLDGSTEANAHYARDSRAFAETFRRYHHDVPATAFFPQDEAALFAAWIAR